jgi:hypothetical protein
MASAIEFRNLTRNLVKRITGKSRALHGSSARGASAEVDGGGPENNL